MTNNADLDGDGKLDEREIRLYERKSGTIRQMAVASLVALFILGAVIFMPFIPDNRIELTSDHYSILVFVFGSLVGAFMGVTAWQSKK